MSYLDRDDNSPRCQALLKKKDKVKKAKVYLDEFGDTQFGFNEIENFSSKSDEDNFGNNTNNDYSDDED